MSSSSRGRRRKRMGDDGWEEWGGYMAAKIKKLQEQVKSDNNVSSKSDIFSGVSIFVNGFTKPSAADLKEIILQHGGIFHHYYKRELVTHIIASNLPNSKVASLSDKKVCKPDWITDSVKAGCLLPYQKYLLYTGQSRLQPSLQFKTDTVMNKQPEEIYGTEESNDNNIPETSTGVNSRNLNVGHNEETSGDAKEAVRHTVVSQSSAISVPVTSKLKQDSGTKETTKTSQTGFRAPSKPGSSNFLSEFYTHSRLHHLSTWGAEFKTYVNQLQQQGDHSYPDRTKLRDIVMQRLSKEAGVHAMECKSKLRVHKGKPSLTDGKLQRVIMHIDMDCFFVSVALRNRPDLVGKPVAVTHSRGVGIARDRPGTDLDFERAYYQNRVLQRKKNSKVNLKNAADAVDLLDDANDCELEDEEHKEELPDLPTDQAAFHSMAEIASCSYEARKAGVHNGMFMGTARQLCPDIVTVPYDFEGYNEVSKTLYDTVAKYTHDIEAVSCDEMLIDCTDVLADTGATPLEFAALLRREIYEATKCNASAGIGPNILIARLATKVAKPNGQHYVSPDKVEEFITDIPVKSIPGVGYSLNSRLLQLGVTTCRDMQVLSLNTLQKELGPKTGQTMYNSCRGIDQQPIRMEKERKSVSAEINYGIRFTQVPEADHFINGLAEEVSSRLEKAGVKGKTITLKMKVRKKGAPKETAKFLGHGVCDNVAKSSTIAMATDNPKVIAKEALSLFHALKLAPEDIRGVGLQISRLELPVSKKRHNGPGSILQFTVIKAKPCTSSHDQNIVNATGSKLETNTIAPGEISRCNNSAEMKTDADSKENVTGKKTDARLVRCSPPPLPVLPSTSDLEVSFSETTYTEPTSEIGCRTAENKRILTDTVNELLLPSPSQVDRVVLNELPADIQLQIERALERKKDSIHHCRSSTESQVPGCSFWQSQPMKSSETNQSEVTGKKSQKVLHENIVALPSFSQVDQSCLAALPADLRLELERAYAGQSAVNMSEKVTAQSDIHPLMRIKQKGSPVHTKKSPRNSPRKSARPSNNQSPSFKVPQNRPRDGKHRQLNPKKLEFVGALKGNDKDLNRKKVKNKQISPHVIPALSQPHVNLAGAVSLTEVKALMTDWIKSSPAPEDEDLTQFVQYLGELVLDKNLEMVDLLIKHLHRLLLKQDTISWWHGAMFILQQTQDIIKAAHGAVLKVSEAWNNIPQQIC